MSARTNKKQRGKKLMMRMGDTVRLNKGRIGLIRYIGKTQFGLGEWIGIELYNELIRTRHNGAVLGKRYFRCPPHRGVFVRRSLIKENIAVLDIQPSINKLRAKEKKMKNDRKKRLKHEREAKKEKNKSKRQSKQLKIQKKYATKNVEKVKEMKMAPIKIIKQNKDNIKRQRSATPTFNTSTSTTRAQKRKNISKQPRSKSPTMPETVNTYSFQSNRRRNIRPRTPTDPPKKRTKKRSKSPYKNKDKKKKKRENDNKKHRTSSSSSKRSTSGSENELNYIEPIIEPIIALNVKVKYNSDYMLTKKQKKKAMSHDLTKQFKDKKIAKFVAEDIVANGAKVKHKTSKSTASITKLKKSKTVPDDDDDDKDRESSPSLSRESVDLPIIHQSGTLQRAGTEPHIIGLKKKKHKVSFGHEDGVCDSDDSSLNDDEEEYDDEDTELKKELEEDFEENFEKTLKIVDEYAHTIDDIETGRKILANKVVQATKRRISQDRRASHDKHIITPNMIGGRQRANGLYNRRNKGISNKFERKKPNNLRVNSVAAMTGRVRGPKRKKSLKQFDVARSRRGSSFVDDYNLNDTLFFDGAEENEEVNDDLIDSDDDDDDDDDNDDNDDKKETFSSMAQHMEQTDVVITLPSRGDATPTIIEGDEDEEEGDETETEIDPLLGTIEDIIEEEHSHSEYEDEEEEEEFKIFDIEQDTAKEKVVIFYVELNEFLECDINTKSITAMKGNEYGKALYVEIGIESGWIISNINGNDDIKSEMEKCDVDNGYNVTFKRMNDEKSPMINEKNNLKPSLVVKSKK